MNHYNHHFEFNKILNSSMSKLYIFQSLMYFVKSLIGIFVPIYLYKSGYFIIDILFFAIGVSIIYLLVIPFSVKLIKTIGFKYTILITIPIYFLYILSLNFIDDIFYFHISWISLGLYMGIFWPAYHSEIALNSSKNKISSQVGTLQILSILFASIAPFIGGIFLELFSYWILLLISSSILFIGSIPLIISPDIKVKKFDFSYKDYVRLIGTEKLSESKKTFACEGVESLLNLYIWPVLVFILLSQNFIKVGILLSIVSFISVFLIYYLKSILDKENKNKVLKKITKLMSLNFFSKSISIFFGTIFLYFIETFSKLVLNAFQLSFSSIFYSNAKKFIYMDYIILRELYLHTIKILFCLIFICLILYFGENLRVIAFMVFFGVFSSLGLSYIKEL